MMLEYVVAPRRDGQTVQTVLRRELGISASLLRRLKREAAIYADGVPVYTNHIVRTGSVISVDVSSAERESGIVPEPGELDILWENRGLLAVNKPAGLLVHPSRSRYTGTLSNYAAHYLLPRGGTCHAVNRLDRDTSGVVLFAKNAHYKYAAAEALQTAEKEYIAVLCGAFENAAGKIEVPIRRFRERDMLRVTAEDGQRAVTHYETISVSKISGGIISAARFLLETGRTHQIRVHCLYMGCPVLGDALYNSEESKRLSEALGVKSQLLHASRLKFIDPVSDEPMEILAEPPGELRRILSQSGEIAY